MRSMRHRRARTRLAALAAVIAAVAAGATASAVPAAAKNPPVTGAAFTTVNEAVDGTGHCQNGNPNVNCNIYDGKQYVWTNGGPISAALGNGTYFFAVLVPGGQADPNDGAAKNLSDDFDTYANRTFTVTGGTFAYSGGHDFADNKIRLAPYADTTNPGGVYILAVCSLGAGYPVDPSTCKYDAFKVGAVQPLKPLTVSKDATGSYTTTYGWSVSKSVDSTRVDTEPGTGATFHYTVDAGHDGGTIGDVTVTGTITVFNPNVDDAGAVVPVDISGVSDVLSDGTVCTVTGGGAQTITETETQFPYTCALSALPQGELDNTVTVTWPDQTDTATGATLDAGSADFTFTGIAFTETVVDGCASVGDSVQGTLGTVCVGDANPTEFTYDRTIDDAPAGTCTDYDNTATFTTSDTGTTGSASQTVTVCVGADLTVVKTAVPSFDRRYKWVVSKSADRTKVKQVGGSVTANYTVGARETGYADSHWTVTGVITVTNPNDWEDVTVDVSDAVDNGATCTVPGASGVVVPASGHVDLPYTCSWQSIAPDPLSGTNTATATWDAAAAHTSDGSATGTRTFDFATTAPTTTARTVTVTDSVQGTLGTLTATDATPFTTGTFTYARSLTVPATNCKAYPNTATLVETGQSAIKTVTVCGPVATKAKTVGYWQNTTGQGLISGGTATGGVCNSATWLRQYAPLQNLSATATCAAVATFVRNTVQAALAAGAGTKTVLKAQFLATALDVFFSDPALGGNKLGASAPLGGVAVDLTRVCTMADASTGSATCGGTYQNDSGAFGGASSRTVGQLLTYAAAQSNAGGSTWYSNVTATQALARNAFDAIANVKAFAA